MGLRTVDDSDLLQVVGRALAQRDTGVVVERVVGPGYVERVIIIISDDDIPRSRAQDLEISALFKVRSCGKLN